MLRKEEILQHPKEVQELLEKFNSREILEARVNEWITFLEKIPVVAKVTIEDDTDILCIFIYQKIKYFLNKNEDVDLAMFMSKTDGTIYLLDDFKKDPPEDKVYKGWRKKKYSSLLEFSQALLELGELYKNVIPIV